MTLWGEAVGPSHFHGSPLLGLPLSCAWAESEALRNLVAFLGESLEDDPVIEGLDIT